MVKLSLITLASGARQLVVHEALLGDRGDRDVYMDNLGQSHLIFPKFLLCSPKSLKLKVGMTANLFS